MVRTLSALSSLRPFTAAARRAASLFSRAGGKAQVSDAMFEALEERTLLAADVTATLTVPAFTALASAGGALSGSIQLANTGNAAATGFTYRVFLSADTVIGNEDDVELTDAAGLQATLAAGGTAFVNLNTFSVPTDVRPGAYFLITTLDTAGVVAEGEAGEANNTVHSTSPVIVLNGPAGSPNVSATITFPARTINPDQHITVPTTIRNTGTGAATNFHVTWVLSVNNIIGDADDIAIDEEEIESLAAGATLSLSRDIQLPVGIDLGSYRVGVWVDDRGDVAETNEGDNRAITSSAALTVGLPDLTATFTTSGGTLQPGGFFTGTLTVRNNTQALATPFSVFISLSTNNIAGDEDDILLMRVDITDPILAETGLAGGAVRTITGLRVYIPYGTAADGGPLNPGAYRVVVQVDGGDEVDESNENNNSTIGSSANVTIGARNTANDPAGSDLFGFAFPISGSFQPGQTINVPAIFANLGNALATGVSMSAYISSDSTFDGGDILLSENVLADEDMDVGSLYALVPLVIPGTAPNGNFFIIFRADPENTVEETEEANNTAATTGTATVTRSTVSITAPDSAAAETTGTANNGQFRIARTGSTTSDLVVNYTIGGTADDGDYNDEAFTGTVTIPAGQSFVLISVPVLNDAAAENDETLVLTISASGNYTVSGSQGSATVNIADNDPRVGVTTVDAAAAESSGTANGGQFRFTRTNGTTGAMVVHFTVSGTAAAGDFTLSVPAGGTLVYDDETGEGTITIADGQASALLNLAVQQDAVGEDAETVIVTIAEDEAYSISPTADDATVTIADDEPLVTVTTNDAAAAETTTTANGGRFTFTRPGPATGLGALVIHFTMTGTATDDGDYTLSSPVAGADLTFDEGEGEWTITIPAGQLSVTLNLAVNDDTTAEDPETAIVNLVANPAYRLGTPAQRTGTVTIADNEPMVTISVVDAQAAEHFAPAVANGGQFRVTRPTANTAGDLIVHFTMSGTAGIEGEYTLVSVAGGGAVTYDPDTGEGTVTILAGEATGLVNLVVTNDAIVELAETAVMTLVGTDDYRVSQVASQRVGTVTIADNEPVISLQATDNTAAEGLINGVPNFGNIRVSRTGDTSEQLTINVVVTGTAVNGDWINFIETTMVIPAGQSFYDNPVVPADDALWENAETIIVTLAAGDGYTVTSTASQRTATVTITDNENTIAVRAQDAAAAEVTGGTANPGQYRFSRTGGTNTAAVTVHFSLAGSALTSDYALAAGAAGANLQFDADTGLGSITIPAGAASVDLNLTAVDDVTGEAVETAVLTLVADPSYRLSLTASQRTATVNIADNEATVVLTTNDRTGAEVTTGTANGGRYTFTRSLASNAAPLTVFFTVTGTATPTLDFTLAAFTAGATLDFDPDTGLGSITIPAGTNVAVLNLNVTDDLLAEAAETAILTVTAGDGYRLGATAAQRSGTVTITDNEPRFAVTATDANGAETASGSANPITFRIARTGGSNGQTSVVNFSMTGTATPGTDYALTMNAAAGVTFDFDPVTGEGTVTFTGTATQATLVATPALDQTIEPVETVVLNLLPATDGGQEYTVSETQGSATGNLTSAVFADIAALDIGELSATEFVFGQGGTVSFDLSVQNLGTTTITSVRGLVFLQRANGTRITINTTNYAVNLAPGESTIITIELNLDDAPNVPIGTYTPGVTATIATGGGGTDVNAGNSTVIDAEQPVTITPVPAP